MVTSHYADSKTGLLTPYLPESWVQEENDRQGKDVYVFKSKLELGLELVDDLISRDISYSHLLIDGWYGNSPNFIKGVESRKSLYITSLYANRRVYYQMPDETDVSEHQMKDIVTGLENDAYTEKVYTKANGEKCKAYVADIMLRVKKLGYQRVLIVKPTKEEKNLEEIEATTCIVMLKVF